MSSIGTGYDLSVQTFSPAGRVFQIEYAQKAVDNSSTVIALRGKDGVVFAAENTIASKLHEAKTTRRVATIDRHIGLAYCGFVTDGRSVANEARSYATRFRDLYGHPMPVSKLNDELSGYFHMLTLYGAARPCGCSVLLGAYDAAKGPQMYMIEPSGVSWGYYGCALGKNKQPAHAEIEKLKLSEMTCKELVKEAARIIYATHDESKDKDFELELAWVCADSNGQFEHVPEELHKEAESFAQTSMEEDSDEEDDSDEDED
ncbi:proteasome subunit alpha type [Salpingoeca rosetta]|uniref:Proteasome subunit alpha type n=1 Tax=Salpingoeca rosetta (strain ATCC 50818 / BSB-021) TaxID=946362 RepID=F2U0S5_SALR5|nr:proteasome subunit alpha type [Salpingoeca rosetta]EGD80499.1 proteasome subunit alpha type [Salpingoeca rosetta]|eukprot:XP_004997060.1 proteasome subunit alpha type [Salpingoeca rosetta]